MKTHLLSKPYYTSFWPSTLGYPGKDVLTLDGSTINVRPGQAGRGGSGGQGEGWRAEGGSCRCGAGACSARRQGEGRRSSAGLAAGHAGRGGDEGWRLQRSVP